MTRPSSPRRLGWSPARGMTAFARETGLGRDTLYKALSGEGNPGFAAVLKVARALGLKLTFSHA